MATVCTPSFADINCQFNRFHRANHLKQNLSGYTDIDQNLEIIDLKTSEATIKLVGPKRATNSLKWHKIGPENWNLYTITYAGDFGDLLVIAHRAEENIKILKGWYKAALVDSNVDTTNTRIGRCFIE